MTCLATRSAKIAAALILVSIVVSASFARSVTASQATPKGTDSQTRAAEGRADANGAKQTSPAVEEWTSYSMEDIPISVKLPSAPQTFTVPASRDMPQGSILKGLVYSGDGLAVLATYGFTPYSGGAYDFVAGMMDGLVRQQGLTNAKLQGDRNSKAQRVPLKIVGKINGVNMEFRGMIYYINDTEEVLMVLTEFVQSNNKTRAMATRALDSVQIGQ